MYICPSSGESVAMGHTPQQSGDGAVGDAELLPSLVNLNRVVLDNICELDMKSCNLCPASEIDWRKATPIEHPETKTAGRIGTRECSLQLWKVALQATAKK